jgi:hypothetical protein
MLDCEISEQLSDTHLRNRMLGFKSIRVMVPLSVTKPEISIPCEALRLTTGNGLKCMVTIATTSAIYGIFVKSMLCII